MADHPSQSINELHWTVVGAGSIGRRHLSNLRALGASRITVVRREPEPVEGDLHEISVRPALEPAHDDRSAAVICTPTARHAADTIGALDAGYHVLLEKPIATDLEEAAQIREAERCAGRVVMIGSCLRFHPAVQELRRVVQSGALGVLHWGAVWCGQHLADWQPGRDYRETYRANAAGGGVLLDLIHEIDYLHWVWGDATLLSACLGDGARLGIDADDSADLVLKLPDAGIITCHLDYLTRPLTRGGRLAATLGSARWDLIERNIEIWRDDGAGWQSLPLPPAWTPNEMYRDELVAFADCVAARRPNPSTTTEATRALATVSSARVAAVDDGS